MFLTVTLVELLHRRSPAAEQCTCRPHLTTNAAVAAKAGDSCATAATRPWCAARCGSICAGAVAHPPAAADRAIASSLLHEATVSKTPQKHLSLYVSVL